MLYVHISDSMYVPREKPQRDGNRTNARVSETENMSGQKEESVCVSGSSAAGGLAAHAAQDIAGNELEVLDMSEQERDTHGSTNTLVNESPARDDTECPITRSRERESE